MKQLLSFILLGVILVSSVALVPVAESQGTNTPGGEFTGGITKAKELAKSAGLSDKTDVFPVIANIIQFLLALSAILAMGAIVWGGIMYIMSLGDESKAEKAKGVIKYAIIGVIIVLLSFVIVSFIKTQLTANAPSFGISTVYAQTTDTKKGFTSGIDAIDKLIKPKDSGLATNPDIIAVILRIVNFMLGLVAVLALAAMIWGALMYILSLGDEGKTEKAKKVILYAIVGVLVAGVSFVLLSVVRNLLVGP